METTRIIHIHGRHSPPTRLQFTTRATTQMLQHPKGPTIFLHHKPMLLSQPARNHSFEKGHVHARSVLGPELGTEQHQLPRQETEAMLQYPQSPTKVLQHEPMPLPQPARYKCFGEGHVHARSVLGPEHGTEEQQLPRQETEDLQQNSERSKHAQKMTELDTRRYLHSHTDSNTHSMHSAPPAVQHSLNRRESLQNAPKEKNEHAACASWSAQDHPFGEEHGQTCTVLGPVQSSKQNMQIFAT